jgi:hypothetical protein
MEANTPIPQASTLPQATPVTNNVNISSEGDNNNSKSYIIFGIISLGLFVIGSMMFSISNNIQLRNIKKQLELQTK